MLIDFTVENYRSIKEPVTLSAIAQRQRSSAGSRRNVKPDNEIAPAYPIEGHDFELLPVLGIFGANASGKSNVINALDYMLGFIVPGDEGQYKYSVKNFKAFRLNVKNTFLPTKFKLRVALNGIVYIYYLSMKNSQILHERLEYIPTQKMRKRLLFDRQKKLDSEEVIWENGSDFTGPYVQLEAWIQSDRPYIKLLGLDLKIDAIEPFTTWLRLLWPGTSLSNIDIDQDISNHMGHSNIEARQEVGKLLRQFDTGIDDFQLIPREDALQRAYLGEYQVSVIHKTEYGPISFELHEESTGTQRLYGLGFRIQHSFKSQSPMLIDELGSNIHPNITREIVKLFQSPKTNPRRAQLIFTSHDNTLQRGNLLRRDQIWFTQKRHDGSTELYPLTDFKPRNDLAIDTAYLDGRFGAVPILPSDNEMMSPVEAVVA